VRVTEPHEIEAGLQARSFEQFFTAEHVKLVALGLAWTGDGHAARELAQESLARAYADWERVQRLEAPGAWVRRVMINLLIDHQRLARRQLRLLERLDANPIIEVDLVNGAWWRAVRDLPDRERAAVTLHYVEDLAIADVAAILEIAPGTVKATLSHARDKLRAALGAGGES
jgi:RNA polymerase sigma-70 factor (ECF subfamily)